MKKITRLLPLIFICLFFYFWNEPSMSLLAQPAFTWAKGMGGTNVNDWGYDIAVDGTGNVYTIGSFFGTTDFDPGAGVFNLTAADYDIFVSKLDANGNFLWAKQMGGTSSDFGYSIAIDGNGNVLTTGYFNRTADFDPGAGVFNLTALGITGPDVFVSKLDANGNFLWAKQMGGTSKDIGYGIAIDNSGNVLTTGYFQDTADFDPGPGAYNLITSTGGIWERNIFVSKLDANGNFLWAKGMGGTIVTDGGEGDGIAVDGSGNILTTGFFRGTVDFDPGAGAYNLTAAGTVDVFISKLDGSGNFLWAKQMIGTGDDYGRDIAIDGSGNVLTIGFFNGTTDFDPGTSAYNFTAGGIWDIFVSKLNSSGNFVWAKQIGGSAGDWSYGYGITVDSNGNVHTTGSFGGTADFDPGAGAYNLTVVGFSSDIFVNILDSLGDFICAGSMGGTGGDGGYAIAVDGSRNILTTGWFSGPTTDFDPGAGTYNLTPAGGSWADIFVSKLGVCTSSFLSTTVTSTNISCNAQCTGTGTATPSNGISPYTYSWNTLPVQTTRTATGLCAGAYTVTVTDAVPTTVIATVTITQPAALTATATSASAACGNNNGSATVNASGGTPSYTYSWNTIPVQTTQTATGLGAGNYTATVTDANGCSATQTVAVVSSGGSINTSQSAILCSGSTYTLPGGTTVNTGGAYIDTLISAAGCDSIITTTLTVNPNPTATAFSNVTITQGQSVTFTASGGGTYSWYPSTGLSCTTCSNPTATASPLWGAGGLVYCVTVTDTNNCTDTACVTVTLEPIDCSNTGELYLPNAFSPNSDGENDFLQVYYGNMICIKTFNLVIYNRWGEKVFNTNDSSAQWDGSYKGKMEGTAVFVFYMKVTLIDNTEVIKQGNISLIR